ncbi:hypothetical protein ACHAXR_012608 [Thalassiosira sp. AJA248-18]
MSSNNDEEDTPNDNESSPSPTGGSTTTVKMFELEDAFEDDGENVVGTKFFGGGAQKDELYIPEDEERALELQNVDKEIEYKRFEDGNAFGDGFARRVGEGLQAAINKILYDEDGGGDSGSSAWKEDPSLTWETPFGSGKTSPLMDLASSKSFYNKLDVAILSATTIQSEGKNVNTVEVRWDIGAVWPNPWESRVLLTGTSILTIREDEESSLVLLKQVDKLDGKNPSDVVGSLSSQLPPRFWDVYHIGMTPSSEKDPRFDAPLLSSSTKSLSTTNKGKKGLLSGYKLSYLPPRLVTEPSLIDTNGRDGRTAQALPNHGFTTAVKTMGPNKEEFVPVSPIEIGIVKAEGTESGSLIKWSVPVPPEFASKALLPLPVMEDEVVDDEKEEEEEEEIKVSANRKKFSSPYTASRTNKPPPTPPQSLGCSYSLRPSRFVATLPYAGNPQDEEVTQLRRQLYQDVVEKDGYTPKLDPETGRPIFFFWMNDAKACFTRKGGLGMAVYEWRADWSKSNEVGIELEC